MENTTRASDTILYPDLEQGSDAWLAARCGLLTASTVGHLITPTRVHVADNDKSRALIRRLAVERATRYVEETYPTRAMERGTLDEPYARAEYEKRTGTDVEQIGLLVRYFGAFTLGYSPDGLVGKDGLIEIKSRCPGIQFATFLDDDAPPENMAQLQAGLMVTGRDWIDYVSYAGGMPLYIKRVGPIVAWQNAIEDACTAAEERIDALVTAYRSATDGLPTTARIDHFADIEV